MTVNVDKLQMQGPGRRSALDRAANQIAQWQLVMPDGEPLAMDFGSNDFDSYGLIEYWAANECEAGYCGKFMFIFDGQTCPLHSHANKHETFYIVQGQVKAVVEKKEQLLNPGEVLAIPTRQLHSFSGVGNALILELSMPCLPEDNIFEQSWAKDWHKACM
jgi:mannose-6-phosphate isomerase-like protein (cupin superfamily)